MSSIGHNKNGVEPGRLEQHYSALSTSLVADAQGRHNVLDPDIQTIAPKTRLIGRALPVRTRGGDNAAIHKALKELASGDVMVISGEGLRSRALIGELVVRRAMVRRCAGFVIDGAVRDVDDITELGFPVFARCHTPAGPFKDGDDGGVCDAVSVGGVVVNKGDIIFGDSDGVVVILAECEPEIHEAAVAKMHREEETRRRIMARNF